MTILAALVYIRPVYKGIFLGALHITSENDAYNLIEWATFRLQNVKKRRERQKTKAREGEDEKEDETLKHGKPHIMRGFLGHTFTIKLEQKSGPEKPRQPQTWQDSTRFSPLDFSLLSPDFRGFVLLDYTENLEKKQKIQWRASNGDSAPKLQISVPCRGRTCPEKMTFWAILGPLIEFIGHSNVLIFEPSSPRKNPMSWRMLGVPRSTLSNCLSLSLSLS